MYDSRLKSNDGDALMNAILSLKDIDECYMFFEDLCTVAELNSIFQRYKVANMLVDKHTCLYQNIMELTSNIRNSSKPGR